MGDRLGILGDNFNMPKLTIKSYPSRADGRTDRNTAQKSWMINGQSE